MKSALVECPEPCDFPQVSFGGIPIMSRRTRWARALMYPAAVLALLAAGLLALNTTRPGVWCKGTMGVGVEDGQLIVAWADARLRHSRPGWMMSTDNANVAFLMASASNWRPNVADASMQVPIPTSPHPRTFRLNILYVPLWPWVILFGGGAAAIWWRTRRTFPAGHCAACGYDLRGTPGAACPECGSGSVIQRALRAVRRLGFRRGRSETVAARG